MELQGVTCHRASGKTRKLDNAKGLVGVDVCRGTCRTTWNPLEYLRMQRCYNSVVQFLHNSKEMPAQLREDTHRKLPTGGTVCGDQELEAT